MKVMPSQWWEIEILSGAELEDSLFWRLQEFGCQGTAQLRTPEGQITRCYIHQDQAQTADLEQLTAQVAADAAVFERPPPTVRWQLIDEEDWSENWKQHWQPMPLGDRLLILPAWLDPPANTSRLIIRLDPGTAFGTGAHPTTQLCLEGLEAEMLAHPTRNQVLADVGCGSGILAIAALRLGAKQVYAVDTDPLAVSATLSNASLNLLNADQLWVAQGSVEHLVDWQHQGLQLDGFLCNILAHIIQVLLPSLSELAVPQTWGILSGILVSQAAMVSESLEEYGWQVERQVNQEGWCRLHVLKGT
jgi:ribosomal protein L11 methyltransferase